MSNRTNTTPDYGPNFIANIVRILDDRTVIVNVGSSKLSVGNNILVYSLVDTIYNLDGSKLASYEYIKDELEVIETSKNYSVCQKTKKRVVENHLGSAFTISPLFDSREEFIPMDVDKEEISPLPQIDRKIHVGDPIKLA